MSKHFCPASTLIGPGGPMFTAVAQEQVRTARTNALRDKLAWPEHDRDVVMAWFETHKPWWASPLQVAIFLDLPPAAVAYAMQVLARKHKLQRIGVGKYRLPTVAAIPDRKLLTRAKAKAKLPVKPVEQPVASCVVESVPVKVAFKPILGFK